MDKEKKANVSKDKLSLKEVKKGMEVCENVFDNDARMYV